MVVLNYPDDSCRRFFKYDNTFFGPIDPNGDFVASTIELTLDGVHWEPHRGIYDENDIIHSSFHGKVDYFPVLADCVPKVVTRYPRALAVPVLGQTQLVECLYGFGCPNIGALVANTSPFIQRLIIRDPKEKSWRLIDCYNSVSTSKTCYVKCTDLKILSWLSPTSILLQYAVRISTKTVAWLAGWVCSAHPQQIQTAFSAVTSWGSTITKTGTYQVWTTDPHRISAPTKIGQDLSAFANTMMNSVFPISEKDFGDLAAAAVKQRRLVNVNIYEFVRDLGAVNELIPKLKNLTALKTHSNNYLTAKYGILPTVDDLTRIQKAFIARKPYFDKFGNTIYNSSFSETQVVDNTIYGIEQHIKVPVANEDDEFQRLLEELDRFGVGLTFTNAWDLVNYSFAIDWFINVGGFLERVDNNLRLIRYNIPYVTMSCKKTVSGQIAPLVSLAFSGPIEWRYYHRWVDSHCPLPPLTLSTTPTVSDHWLEAGALIIQRAL